MSHYAIEMMLEAEHPFSSDDDDANFMMQEFPRATDNQALYSRSTYSWVLEMPQDEKGS